MIIEIIVRFNVEIPDDLENLDNCWIDFNKESFQLIQDGSELPTKLNEFETMDIEQLS